MAVLSASIITFQLDQKQMDDITETRAFILRSSVDYIFQRHNISKTVYGLHLHENETKLVTEVLEAADK